MLHRDDLCLADVLPAAAHSLGVDAYADRLGMGECEIVIVCLVDGLGATAIERHHDAFPSLGQAAGGSIEAAFPTTTATGLATLGTGLPPGQHGVLGASFYLPDRDELLSPLHWGSDPHPTAVQPERTVFEVCVDAGVRCTALGPAAYAGSGLTRAVLRGSDYVHAESIDDRIDGIRELVSRASSTDSRELAYVYWPALDRAGHEFGPESAQWCAAAADVDELIGRIRAELPDRGAVIVTADHGMVDSGERVWVEDEPMLSWGVRMLGGEPRMRHLYCDPDDVDGVRARWAQVFGNRVSIRTRDEAIDDHLFGPVDPSLAERIGDLVVVCDPGTSVASRSADPRLSGLPGQHGGLSDDERRIPGLILRGGR